MLEIKLKKKFRWSYTASSAGSGSLVNTSIVFLLTGMMLILVSCASTGEITEDELDQLLDEAAEQYQPAEEESALEAEKALEELVEMVEDYWSELPELDFNLQNYRSSLADQRSVSRNEIPEHYYPIEREERQSVNNRGFRIQIISTQDARLAEDIREDYEEWINEVSTPPYPQAYMIFQQPYYRVQIGDFRDRNVAMEFTDFVRLRYPDAWVVHSQINPARAER